MRPVDLHGGLADGPLTPFLPPCRWTSDLQILEGQVIVMFSGVCDFAIW